MNDAEGFKKNLEVLNYTPNGAFLITSDYTVVFWNYILTGWTGIKENEILGQKIHKFFPNLNEPKFRLRLDSIFNGGGPTVFSSQIHDYILPIKGKGDEFQIQHVTVSPISFPNNPEIYCLFSIQDVTDLNKQLKDYQTLTEMSKIEVEERKRAEMALEESNELLEKIFDNQLVMTAYMDTHFNFIRVNKSYARASGDSSPDSFVGKNYFKLFPNKENIDIFQKVLYTGERYEAYSQAFENTKHPEMGVTYWDWTLEPVKDHSGTVEGILLSLLDVTERIKAEKESIQAKQIIENSNNILFKWKATHKWPTEYVTENVSQIGYTAKEFLSGQTLYSDIILPIDLPKVTKEVIYNTKNHIDNFKQQYRIIDKEGNLRWIEDWTIIIRNDRGEVTHYHGIIVDITKTKTLEENIKTSEEKYKKIFEISPQAILVLDDKGVVLDVNSRMEQWLGFPGNEILGKKLDSLPFLPEESVDIAVSAFNKRISGKTLSPYEMTFITKDRIKQTGLIYGALLDIEDNSYNVQDLIMISDITEQKKSETHLKQSEEKFRTLFQYAPVGTALLDLKGHPYLTNITLQKILGYSGEELKAMSFTEFTHPEDKIIDRTLFKELIGGHRDYYEMEKRYIHKDGRLVWGSLAVSIIRNTDGSPQTLIGMVADITERKGAEKALKQSQQKLSFHLSQTPLGVIEWDNKFCVMEWNKAAEKIFGYKKSEAMGKHAAELIVPEEYKEYVDVIWKQLFTKKGGDHSVNENITKTNEIIMCEWFNTQLVDDNNKVIGVASLVQNITRRLKDEKSLKRANLSLKALTECRWMLIHAKDEKTITGKICQILADIISYKLVWIGFIEHDEKKTIHPVAWSGEDSGYLSENFISWADNEYGNGPSGTAIRTGKPGFARNIMSDSQFSPWRDEALKRGYSSSVAIPLIQNEEAIGVIGLYSSEPDAFDDEEINLLLNLSADIMYGIRALQDQKERKEAEKALIESESRYRNIINTTTEGFWLIDPKLGTVDVNDSFCKMLGYQRDEIIGKSPLDFVDEQNRKIFQKQTSQISSTDHRVYDITLKTKAGRDLPTIFHAATLRDSHGDILNAFALVTDLTEHNRSKEELIRAKKEAEEASQAKSTFLANMSHEIRTPMNAILGFAEILENYIHDKKQRYFLNAIESSGKTLLNLINDILDLSKVEAGKLDLEYTYVNLSSVFSDMQLIFSHRMKEKGLELIVEDISDFPNKVYLDESRLKQILLNLLGNALKFTDSGYVRLWSRFEYLEGNDSLIKLTVVVEDTGIGVSRDQKELIFNAFEQQKGQSSAKYGGTGLGLAITQRLVELLNGQIYMEDREGGGSEFYIVFDGVKVMQDEEFNRKQRMSLSINALNFFPATILIADDDQLNRDVIKGYLDEYPFSVVEAENGLQAVEQTKSQKPDLVLMDLKMPVVDGIEASRRIRDLSQFKDIPIIAITASAMKESLDKAKSICHSVLTKPVNKEKLLSEMAQFLRHAINQDNSEDKKISPENDEIVIDELTTQQIKNLPELISNLDGDLYNRWEDMTITLTIKDIQEFALEIQELGKKYNLNSLILWGDKLFQEANMFDIESLPDTLKKYPSFIQRLKAYIGDK